MSLSATLTQAIAAAREARAAYREANETLARDALRDQERPGERARVRGLCARVWELESEALQLFTREHLR